MVFYGTVCWQISMFLKYFYKATPYTTIDFYWFSGITLSQMCIFIESANVVEVKLEWADIVFVQVCFCGRGDCRTCQAEKAAELSRLPGCVSCLKYDQDEHSCRSHSKPHREKNHVRFNIPPDIDNDDGGRSTMERRKTCKKKIIDSG